MNTIMMSALCALGIAGFFGIAPSFSGSADEGCCAKSTEQPVSKKQDGCCADKTADCCVKQEPCCFEGAGNSKRGEQPDHCGKDQPKAKAPGSDVEGRKAGSCCSGMK